MLAGGGAFLAQAAPSDRIVMGVIGSGGRGTFVMTVFQKDPAVSVGAICDVYEPNLERALSTASKARHPSQGVPQLQAASRRQRYSGGADRDARALARIRWCSMLWPPARTSMSRSLSARRPSRAGSWWRPRRRSKNIIQVGMQRRSYDLYLEGREIVAAGTLGNVRMVRSWWLNNYLGGDAGYEARRAARLGAMAGARASTHASIPTGSATGGSIRTTPAASWRTRARMSSTASTC